MSYWDTREVKAREKSLDRNIAETEKILKKYYKTTSKHLANKILEYYDELIEKTDVLDSHRFSYNKYYDLCNEIEKELKALGEKEVRTMDKKLTDTYKDNVNILKSEGYALGNSLNKKVIKQVVNEYWVGDNLNWSSRVWRNKAQMENILKQGIFEIISTGKSPASVTKMVSKKCGQSYYNASRLVRTELAHVQTQSTLKVYKEAGIEKYTYLTAHDERTCPECSSLDGEEFSINDVKTGENFPPLHANCRCSLLAVIDKE